MHVVLPKIVRSSLCLFTVTLALAGASAAQQVAPEAYRQLRYRHIGPVGNRIASVVGVPGDPMTYYAGAASGGIWKTTDGGEYWEPVFDSQTDHSVGAMAVAPSDPAIVWAGTGEPHIRSNVSLGTGVYKSTDAGATWRHMGLGEGGPTRMSRIVIHPHDPDIVYVGALGHAHGPQQARGVFRTMDGGESWEHVLFVDENTGASSIEMDPSNPAQAVRRHVDGGGPHLGPGERRRGRRHLHVRRRRGHVDETRGRRVAGAAGREDRHLPDPGGSQPGLRAHRNGRRRALARARDRERRVLALARRGHVLGAHEPLPRPGRTHRLLQQLFRQPGRPGRSLLPDLRVFALAGRRPHLRQPPGSAAARRRLPRHVDRPAGRRPHDRGQRPERVGLDEPGHVVALHRAAHRPDVPRHGGQCDPVQRARQPAGRAFVPWAQQQPHRRLRGHRRADFAFRMGHRGRRRERIRHAGPRRPQHRLVERVGLGGEGRRRGSLGRPQTASSAMSRSGRNWPAAIRPAGCATASSGPSRCTSRHTTGTPSS